MIPWFDASAITILGVLIPTQGVLAIAGIAVGHLAFTRWLQRYLGVMPVESDLMGFAIITAAVIVGHVAAVLITGSSEPLWHVTLPQSSLGALLGGGIVGLLLSWRWGLDLPIVIDAAAWGFLHGWPLVRFGCVLAHDHPGRLSTLPFAVAFPHGARLDIGLLEWLFCLALLFFARALMRRSPPPGRLAAWATLLFASGRLLLEFLRVDRTDQLLQTANLTAICVCVLGLGIGAVLWYVSRPAPAEPA